MTNIVLQISTSRLSASHKSVKRPTKMNDVARNQKHPNSHPVIDIGAFTNENRYDDMNDIILSIILHPDVKEITFENSDFYTEIFGFLKFQNEYVIEGFISMLSHTANCHFVKNYSEKDFWDFLKHFDKISDCVIRRLLKDKLTEFHEKRICDEYSAKYTNILKNAYKSN